MSGTRAICPKCGRADAVRKVTAIVSEGTVTTDTSGLGVMTGEDGGELVGFSGVSASRSALVQKLSPPQKPSKPFGYRWVGVLLFSRIGLGVFVLMLILALIVCSFPILVGTYRENPIWVLVPILVVAVFVVLLLRWVIASLWRDVYSARVNRADFPTNYTLWERAFARWKQLYYCYRDDGVFSPNHAVFVPAGQMKQYLYATSRNKQKREPIRLKMDSRKNRS